MLNVSEAMNADAVKAYFKAGDYYIDGHDSPGVWGGRLMEEFRLSGPVEREAFDRLADGYHPVTGEDLTQVRLDNRRAANDITISAPKPVTLLYMRTGDQRILDAFEASCDDIMAIMEREAAVRVRKDGADHDRVTGNWGYAGFTHFEARPDKDSELPAPQIHRHHVVFNLSRDPAENQIKALQLGIVKGNADLYMPLFHNILADRMRQLGYGIERTGKVGFGIQGVPRDLVERFSPRRLTILEAKAAIAEAQGITDPERLRRLQAELAVLTRKHKQKDLTKDELWDYWDRQMTDGDREALDSAHLHAAQGWATTDAEAARYAIAHLFQRQAVIEGDAEKKLLIEALRYGVGSVSIDGLRAEFREQGVIFVDRDGVELATTQTLVDQSRFMNDFAAAGKGVRRPIVSADYVLPTLHTAQGHELDAGQRDVILGFLRSPDAVNMLDAGPGTGKTDSMAAYGRILAEHGQPVTWLGTTGTATEELVKAGLPATTVASFLLSEKAQAAAKGGRVVVDEVSMLGHADAYKLFRLAEQHGFRLDCVGDSQQHKSPVAGDIMKLMRREAGVRTFELTDIKRQQGEYKAAVEAIRRGDLARGHRKLKEQGFVRELPQAELFDRGAELYVRWAKEDGYVPVATLTHAEADELTARIRARLKQETVGEGRKARPMLPEEERPVVSYFNLGWSDAQLADARKHGAPDGVVLLPRGAYRKDLIPLAKDDLVRVSMAGKTKDGRHKLTTGRLYHIGGFDKDGNPVLAENGWVVDKEWGGLRHGYVGTSQAVQGKTSRRAIAVYGEASLRPVKRPGFYVPITRAKKELAVLVSDEKLLAERIQRRDERMTPTEAVGRKRAGRPATGQSLVLSLQKHVARLHELARLPAESVRPVVRHREAHEHAR